MALSDRPEDVFGESLTIAKARASLNSRDFAVPRAISDALAAINGGGFVVPHAVSDALAAIEAGSIASSIGSIYSAQISSMIDAQTSLYSTSISATLAGALESSTYKSLIGAQDVHMRTFGPGSVYASQFSGMIGSPSALLAQIEPITSAISDVYAHHTADLGAIFASTGRLSSMYDEILSASKLASQAAMQSRLWTLEKAFDTASETDADGFGRLRDATSEIPRLTDAIEGGIHATQTRGTFGPNLTPLRESAQAVAEIMDGGGEKALKRPLAEVRDLAALDDEWLLDFGEALGWWDHIKSHRVSTAGILVGFTAGLVRFVLGTGSPEAVYDSVATGGAVYLFMSSRRLPERDPEKD